LVYVLGREDCNRDWLFARCREVQRWPDGYLDLWAREHYKSTIITYALTIQDILNDPDITIWIFTFTRPIAKAFLRQIKLEFESNATLKKLFPEILYDNPRKDSPKWSEDDGIIVKRDSNPKEATVEASGLVDGMPTGRHYKLRVYDDVITERSVSTPDMIRKVTQAWELSQNLGAEGGRARYIGTRYHFADTYHVMKDRGSVVPREYPATIDGSEKGAPVLISEESLAQKRRDMGPYVFSCQMLLNPVAEEMQELKPVWLRTWAASNYTGMNIYLMCDPAGETKKENDYTVFTVWGIGPDQNYYVIEWVRDRLNLTQRANVLFSLQRKYKPLGVYYEKYGMQSDIEHYEDRMARENYRFRIVPVGGQVKKEDRIRKLVPLFESERIYIPESCIYRTVNNEMHDLTRCFIEEEYKLFPFSVHDDMLDCMARVVDVQVSAPDSVDFLGVDMSSLEGRNVMTARHALRVPQFDYDVLRDGMR
jgi:predicted phage terminase large subunit-like protein